MMLIKNYYVNFRKLGDFQFGVGREKAKLIFSLLFPIVIAFIYYASARFGMSLFTLFPTNISLLWLPAGIGFIMCLRWGWFAFPLIVIASYCANLPGMSIASVDNPQLHTLVASLADGIQSIVAMYIFRLVLPDGVFDARTLSKFVLWICIIPPAISSAIISINLFVGGYIPNYYIEQMFICLLMADALGMLLVYQVYNCFQLMPAKLARPSPALLALIFLLIIIFIVGFWSYPAIIFLMLPVLVIMSFEMNLLLVSLISSISFIALIAGTHLELGPFVSLTDQTTGLQLVAFCFACSMTIYGLGLQQYQMRKAKASSELWKEAAEHDSLTGLPNRRAFMPALAKEHHRSVRMNHNYCIVIWDIDDFKLLNDNFGHDFGDQVLIRLAQVMRENCRDIDYYARIGGEEFAVLLPGTDAQSGKIAMERFRQQVANELFVSPDGEELTVTISIGIACLNQRELSDRELMSEADKALYQSKARGKNCTSISCA